MQKPHPQKGCGILPNMLHNKNLLGNYHRTKMVLSIIGFLIKLIQPILIPLCFLLAWLLIILLGWTVLGTIAVIASKSKQMHQIPCSNCQFATNDYRLKCTVQPFIANTEAAIDCSDYRSI